MRTPSDVPGHTGAGSQAGMQAADVDGASPDTALCRAVLYSALSLGFRRPTAQTLAGLTTADATAALADAARVLDALRVSAPLRSGEGQGQGIEGAAGRQGSLARHAVALERGVADLHALDAEHRRLFGHTAKGEVPPYETEYGDEALFQQPQELSDIAGFMRAFGLTLQPESHERVDHVSCECELLAFLAYKEAYATTIGDLEMRAATERATVLFLQAHLARFAPTFTRRIQRTAPRGFYATLAELLRALVELDCARLRMTTGSDQLGFRPDPAACAAPMGCDAEERAECGGGACPS